MVVGAKVCELTDGFLGFVCGLYVGISMSPLRGDVEIQLPRPRMCCSQSPPAATERVEQLHLE